MNFALANPVEQTASLLGFLFGVSGEEVLGRGKPRATRDGTTLRYVLLHLLAKPPAQDVSPIGLSLTQDEIVAAMGRTDRGLVKVGAGAIESQITYTEPHLALTAIADWIARFFALLAEGRALANQIAREDVKPNPDVIGWRQSLTWQRIIAFGRALRNDEPLAERTDLWDEQEEEDVRREAERQAQAKEAARRATAARHAPAKAKAATTQAIAEQALQRVAKARETRADPMLKKSQAALDAVCGDPTLRGLLGRLEIAPPGFVALSGKQAFARVSKPNPDRNALEATVFFKATAKQMVKDVKFALSKLFPGTQIAHCEYGEGKHSGWRAYAMLPGAA